MAEHFSEAVVRLRKDKMVRVIDCGGTRMGNCRVYVKQLTTFHPAVELFVVCGNWTYSTQFWKCMLRLKNPAAIICNESFVREAKDSTSFTAEFNVQFRDDHSHGEILGGISTIIACPTNSCLNDGVVSFECESDGGTTDPQTFSIFP